MSPVIDFRARPNTTEWARYLARRAIAIRSEAGTTFGNYHAPEETLGEFIAQLDRAGIDRAVLAARNRCSGDREFTLTNDFVAECVRAFPHRIVGFGGIALSTSLENDRQIPGQIFLSRRRENPMANARELLVNIRTEMRSLEEKILRHRYLAALETGRLPREMLRTFAGQQYRIITSDLRSIALLISRYGNLPSRPYLLGVLEGENAALDALWKFARALGMSDKEIRTAESIPAALAYSAFIAWLALYGSDAELAAALGVNFAAWGANCGRMSAALKAHYGLEPDAVAFFDLFANRPLADEAALAVIQGGLDRGITPAQIARAARLLQGYELMYWDSMLEAAGL